jgi:hypothetical protein
MHRVTRRAAHGQPTKRSPATLPEIVGGTITGGPMEPLDLMEILARGTRGASGSGAVPGAAHLMAIVLSPVNGADRGVALSDGSRIVFSSVDDLHAWRGETIDQLSDA